MPTRAIVPAVPQYIPLLLPKRLRQLLSAPGFYRASAPWMFWLGLASLLLLSIGAAWGLFFAPPDARQGDSYRIIFVHVPASFVALANYYVMAVAGGMALVWRLRLAALIMHCCAPIGAAMTFLALFTGSVWGLPTWGDWWVWDARVTSMLVLLFLYLGVLGLRRAFDDSALADRACAIMCLAGSVNIVIVYKSVDWWYSLHQPASISLFSAPTIHASMAYPLFVMLAGFYCCYALALLSSARVALLMRDERRRWVLSLLAAARR